MADGEVRFGVAVVWRRGRLAHWRLARGRGAAREPEWRILDALTALDRPRQARAGPRAGAVDAALDAAHDSAEDVSFDVVFLLKCFFRLLATARSAGCAPGLLRVVRGVPLVLRHMPPLALASRADGDDSDSDEGGPVAPAPRTLMLGVVDAVTETIAEMMRDKEGLKKDFSPQERAAVYAAAVAVSVKRGRCAQLLAVAQELLCEGARGGDEKEDEDECRLDLFVEPYLRELRSAKAPRPWYLKGLEEQGARQGASSAPDGAQEGGCARKGWLMTCGRAAHGELCHGALSECRARPALVEALRDVELGNVSANSTHVIAVTAAGGVIVWGEASDETPMQHDEELPSESRFVTPANQRGAWPRVVAPRCFGDVRAAWVACGLGHVLVLLEDGAVFAWGDGAHGRLGLGGLESRATPAKVLGIAKIASVGCGAAHSLAVSESGAGFAWGKNAQGQCGNGSQEDVFKPTQLSGVAKPLSQLVGGWEHTLARRRDGRVLSFGSGYRDARRGAVPPVLGHGGTERCVVAKVVAGLGGVVHIACGWDHSMAVDSSGCLYTWGAGGHGKLGHGDEASRDVPTKVRGLYDVAVACGGCQHSVAIDARGDVWSWGDAEGGRLGLERPLESDGLDASLRGAAAAELRPRRLESLAYAHVRATAVAVGDKYTMVLVRSKDEVDDEVREAKSSGAAVLQCGSEDSAEGGSWRAQSGAFATALRAAVDAAPLSEDGDGAATSPWQCALSLLGHMERFASAYVPLNVQSSSPDQLVQNDLRRLELEAALLSDAAGVSRADGPNDAAGLQNPKGVSSVELATYKRAWARTLAWPYALEASREALRTLAALVDRFSGDVVSPLLRGASGNDARLRKFAVLFFSLGVLRANVYWLVMRTATHRGISAAGVSEDDWAVLNGAQGASYESPLGASQEGRPAMEARGPEFEPEACEEKRCDESWGSRGSRGSRTRLDDDEVVQDEVQRTIWNSLIPEAAFSDSIAKVHAVLLNVLSNASSAAVEHDSAKIVEGLVLDIMSLGFPIFYPSWTSRLDLVVSVANDNPGNKRLVSALADQLCGDDVLSGLIAAIFSCHDDDVTASKKRSDSTGSNESPAKVMRPDDLGRLMQQLVRRALIEGASPALRLILSLQGHVLSLWADSEAHATAQAAVERVAVGHAKSVFAEACKCLETAAEPNSVALTLVPALCASLYVVGASPKRAFGAAQKLLPQMLHLFKKVDAANLVGDALAALEWGLARAVSRFTAAVIDHADEDAKCAAAWLDSSRLFEADFFIQDGPPESDALWTSLDLALAQWLGPAQPGPAQPGPAQPGPAQPAEQRLGRRPAAWSHAAGTEEEVEFIRDLVEGRPNSPALSLDARMAIEAAEGAHCAEGGSDEEPWQKSVAHVRRAFVAALLRCNGLSPDAVLAAQGAGLDNPKLLAVWRAAHHGLSATRLRQALELAHGSARKPLAAEAARRAGRNVLLLLSGCNLTSFDVRFEVALVAPAPPPAEERLRDWKRKNPEAKWAEVTDLVNTLDAWRQAASKSERPLDAKLVKLLESPTAAVSDVVDALVGNDGGDDDGPLALSELARFLMRGADVAATTAAMASRSLSARRRRLGFDVLHHLFSTVRSERATRCVVEVLCARHTLGVRPVLRHHLDGLRGAWPADIESARFAFQGLFGCVSTLLENAAGPADQLVLLEAISAVFIIKLDLAKTDAHLRGVVHRVAKTSAALLRGTGDVVDVSEDFVVRDCASGACWRSLKHMCESNDAREAHADASDEITTRERVHRAAWRVLAALAVQMARRGAGPVDASELAQSSAACEAAFESVVLDELFSESGRVRHSLSGLVGLQRQFSRVHKSTRATFLFGGLLPLGSAGPTVRLEESPLEDYSISFWLWLKSSLVSAKDDVAKDDGAFFSVVSHLGVRRRFDVEAVWELVVRSDDSALAEENSVRLSTGRWVHICQCHSSTHTETFVDADLVSRCIASSAAPPRDVRIGGAVASIGGAAAKKPRSETKNNDSDAHREVDCHRDVEERASAGFFADVAFHSTGVSKRSDLISLVECRVSGVRAARHTLAAEYSGNIVQLLAKLAETPLGAAKLAAGAWPLSLAKLLAVSGGTAQTAILRLLRQLAAPDRAPDFIASFHSVEQAAGVETFAVGSGASIASRKRNAAAAAVVDLLCDLLCQGHFATAHTPPLSMYSSTFASKDAATAALLRRSAQLRFEGAQLRFEGFQAGASGGLRVGASGSSEVVSFGAADDESFMISSASRRRRTVDVDAETLTCEIVLLLRSFMASRIWREAIQKRFSNAIAGFVEEEATFDDLNLAFGDDAAETSSDAVPRVNDAARKKQRNVRVALGAVLAAVDVLGGQAQGARDGGLCIVPAGLYAVVGDVQYRTCRASRGVVVCASEEYNHAFVSVLEDDCGAVTWSSLSGGLSTESPARTALPRGLAFVLPLRDVLCSADVEEPIFGPMSSHGFLTHLGRIIASSPPPFDQDECSEDELAPHNGKAGSLSSLIRAHVRCRAVKMMAAQSKFAPVSRAILASDLFDDLVELAVTDVGSVCSRLLGRHAENVETGVIHRLVLHLEKGDADVFDLERLATASWRRASAILSSNALHRKSGSESDEASWKAPWDKAAPQNHVAEKRLVAFAGEMALDGARACAMRHFPTLKFEGVSLNDDCAGRWYYEVVLLTDGLMQVGWADSDFACEPVRGQGVGDHTSSWAWDGFRMKRWNISSAPYGERWATGDVVGVLLDCDKREMRYFLNGCDLGVAFRGFRAKGLFPAASLNVGQAAHLNFGTAPFLRRGRVEFDSREASPLVHPPTLEQTDHLGFSAVLYAPPVRGVRGGSSNSSTTTEVGRVSSARRSALAAADALTGDAALQRAAYAAVDEEYKRAADDDDLVAELELRQQALIENLVGMGFPVDWAIRAAEHCDVTLNESLAIAWIIERMSDETAQNEEGFGAGGYGDADDYGDDGDDAADLRVAESRDGAPGYGGRVLDDYYNRGTTALSEDKVDVSAALRGDEEGEESSGQVDLDGKRRSAVEYDFEGDSLSTFDSLYAAIALPRLSLAPLVEQRAQAPRHAGLSNNDDASFCAEDAAGPADAATAPRLATSWTEADGAAGVTAGGASAGDASVDYSELPASARRPTALEALGTNASDDEIVVVCFLAEAALAVLWARSACVNVLHHAASTESFPANVSQAESQTLNLVSLLRLTVVLGDSVKSIGHEARALATPAQWHALLDAPGVLVSRGRPSMLAPAFRARTSLDPSVTVEAQFGEMLGLGNLDAVKMVRAVLEKVEGPLLEALLETAMIDFDRARHRDHNAARWCGNADARTDADALGAKRPNVAWAAAVLTALMARAEVVASEEDDDNESEGETPAEHETPAPLRREGSQVVLRVFSPGLLGTLLNASASPNLHLKRLSLDLASRVLRFARLHARRKMTASVVSPAAKHRLRGLLRAASPRLHDGAARSAPHSPDVVALFSTCLEWRALEVDLAFADDGPQQVDVLASEGKAEYQLTLEDVSSDCIAVSWGGWDYTEAPPRAVAAKETAKVNLGVENLGVENLGVENLVLEARPVAFKSGASRPFEACGGALARRGCFVVDGLKSDSRYQLRLCAFDAGRRVYTGPLMAAATAAEALYQLDPAACGPNLVLSNGGATVTNRLNKKWNACRAAVGFSTGVRCWEVRIERCCSKNIFIGVQRAEATLENYVGADRYGWGYLANRALWNNKAKVRSYGELFRAGDVVGVQLDCDAGELSFTRNGRPLGVAVSGLDGVLYPAFSLYNKGDQLTIAAPAAGSPGHDEARGSPREDRVYGDECWSGFGAARAVAHVDAALSFLQLAKALPVFPDCRDGRPLAPCPESPQLAEADFTRVYQKWIKLRLPTTQITHTADGRRICVDSAESECLKFGLRFGDVIKLGAAGDVTVIGVFDGFLWCLAAGGALPLSRRQVHEMKTRPGEYEILRATEIVRVKAETATATRTTVVAALKWRWTAEMDEVLVECLDEAPPEETFSTAVDLYVARNVDGPCRDFVEVRLALLCELNELAAPLLPLVGSEGSFGDEDAPARLVSDGMSFLAPHGAADLSVCIRAHAFRISAHLKLQLVARHVSTNHVSTRRPPTDADDADDADDAPANAQPELRLVDAAAIESAENAHHGCLDAAWWKRERWLAHSFVGQTASQLAERTAAQTHHACRGAMDAGGHAFTVAMIRADGSPAASAPNDALAAFFARVAFEAQEALLDRGGGVQGSFAEPPTCGERRPLVAVDASRLAAFRTLGLAVSLALRSGTPLPLDAAPHVWAAVVGAAPRGTGDDALGRAAACLGSLETCGVSRADAAALFGGAALAAPLEDGRLVELCEGGLSKPLSFDGAQSFAALLVSARRRASAPELAALRAGAEAAVPRRLLSLFTARQLAWRLHAPTAAPL